MSQLMSPTAHKLLTLITCAGLCVYFSLPPTHSRLQLNSPRHPFRPAPSPPPIADPLPRAVLGRDQSFASYLDARFPLVPDLAETMDTLPDGSKMGPHVWLTMADEAWVQSGARALDVFVRALNAERRAKYGEMARETVVVTLCLDEACLEECENAGMYCYGGYTFTKPPLVSWTKWIPLAKGVCHRADAQHPTSNRWRSSSTYTHPLARRPRSTETDPRPL